MFRCHRNDQVCKVNFIQLSLWALYQVGTWDWSEELRKLLTTWVTHTRLQCWCSAAHANHTQQPFVDDLCACVCGPACVRACVPEYLLPPLRRLTLPLHIWWRANLCIDLSTQRIRNTSWQSHSNLSCVNQTANRLCGKDLESLLIVFSHLSIYFCHMSSDLEFGAIKSWAHSLRQSGIAEFASLQYKSFPVALKMILNWNT